MTYKTTYTVLFLFINCFIFAQTTSIPDNNFEQALIDLGHDSGPLDNLVLTSTIAAISSLDISNKGIKDLTGIEAFTTLSTLNCSNNELETLDLSSNTALLNLNCDNNLLSTLSVKNGNNLVVKNGGGSYSALNNRLFCIDVDLLAGYSPFVPGTTRWISSDTEVKGFSDNCAGISVTQFISSFPADIVNILMTHADTDNNGILLLSEVLAFKETLDLSALSSISDLSFLDSFVNIKGLILGNNNLPNIDFSRYADMEKLDLANTNSLTSLDLSGNSKLTSLINSGSTLLQTIDVSKNPLLTKIVMENCPVLQALNISTTTGLDSLVAKGNTTLTSITFPSTAAKGTSKSNHNKIAAANTTLKTMDVSNNGLTNLDVSNFTALTKLLCNDNNLTVLKVNNGNNSNMTSANFNATGNNSLTTITVDNAAYSLANWTNKDAGAAYVSAVLSSKTEKLNTFINSYPNPFTDYIKLEFPSNITIENVALKDISGKELPNIILKENTIKLSHIPNGMYLLIVKTDLGAIAKKIIKQNK